MAGDSKERILAEEFAVTVRKSGLKGAVEAEFGFKVVEGTLVLTNERLVFVSTDETTEDLAVGAPAPWSNKLVMYSDVEDLASIPEGPANLSVRLEEVTSVRGRKGELTRPALEVEWGAGEGKVKAEFTEVLTGKRKRSLNDWAKVIQGLKDGTQKILELADLPPEDSLPGKVVRVLADMQEKGVVDIEDEVESAYKIDSDPDAVEDACNSLLAMGLVKKFQDAGAEPYFRKVSPLGDDDLSA